MIVRWLVLHGCRSKSEIRLLLRTLDASFDAEGHFVNTRVSKRIARNPRLALIWSVVAMHASSPALLTAGMVSLVILLVIAIVRVVGSFI
jgi:hypothetical protein